MPCRLVIKMESTNFPPPNDHLNRLKFQPGDTIYAFPKGFDVGRKMRNNPKFLVVDVDDMTLAEGETLTAGRGDDPDDPEYRRRHECLDYAALSARGRVDTLTRADVRSMRKVADVNRA